MKMTHKIGIFHNTLIILIGLTFFLSACSLDFSSWFNSSPTAPSPITSDQPDLSYTKVTFRAKPPANAPKGNITLEILDEVTGLAMNPQRYPMIENSDGSFQLELIFPIGSVVKYRYLRGDFPYFVEYNAHGEQVRYRMAAVNYPLFVEDTIAGWTDFRFNGLTGTIKGQVFDASTKAPFPNALVCVGGIQTLTASDGSFIVENIAEGIHNLVVYSIDGSFQTFQQGAVVAADSTTLALTPLTPSRFVNVTFIVQTPPTNLQGVPVRMVGNIYSLGNTFAEVNGGFSVIAARAPLLTNVAENAYAITLRLPAGFDLRYKYTLGDGFWNAEHDQSGGFVLRQLIVPQNDTTITDQVTSWQSVNTQPITFLVSAPNNTPLEDSVSIQFNPYTWTNPLPMWPLGNNQWLYVLYSPLNMFNSLQYRYCRNDQCGHADDLATAGTQAEGYPLVVSSESQIRRDEIKAWSNWNTTSSSTEIVAPTPQSRLNDFVRGIEISPNYNPTWQPYLFWGMNKISLLKANTTVLTPGWSYVNVGTPNFEPVAGKDSLWLDNIQAIQTIQQANMTAWLYPHLRNGSEVWSEPHLEKAWWENWFERYHTFAIHFADLAAQTSTPALILGGPQVAPALPAGVLPSGEASGVPDFADERWQSIVENVRQRYNGKLGWSIQITDKSPTIPEWVVERMDFLYVQLVIPSLYSSSTPQDDRLSQVEDYLDTILLPIRESTGKPIVVAINLPSAITDSSICNNENCLTLETFFPPLSPTEQFTPDLQLQADSYSALLSAINERSWIDGVVSQGFYPPAAIQDASSSIHGKPASDVLWYWFLGWSGNNP
ncbi:hypothetical protein BECAL_02018 [Bellilinea caldifistulae]|uniref:CBM20 domain-containing protein n=1 Tax=Bellilinea caldifistulae TaxID=360411 RepID=A0A0P6WZZ7_9CHLR|nr:hypothetical protein [Bellilinea caldifistulae]KPL72455.1 hypothetical protein AC812_15685 [Bellilinea caldifistulae]GAP10842.1 hypothetical protein BECAL_02018 [Bellilinea caldifistulae]